MVTWLGAALVLDRIGTGELTPRTEYDAIVVAGAGVLSGGRPGRPLQARVERAVELYRRGVAPRIVMTGGVGTHPPAESVVASRIAESMGVPPEAILRDTVSSTTDENAIEAARLIGWNQRIVLVTDRFHVYRARRMFARHFRHVDAIGCVSAPWPRFRGAMREVVAVALHSAVGDI